MELTADRPGNAAGRRHRRCLRGGRPSGRSDHLRAAAELEGSKVFGKDLLLYADAPTADYQTFADVEEAKKFLRTNARTFPSWSRPTGWRLARGLSCVPDATRCFPGRRTDSARGKVFGAAGDRLVIEDGLDGQEASVLAITDGRTIITLQPAQDHKSAFDGDTGPNTGGRGADCPAPLVDDAMLHWIEEHILVPTVHAMKRVRRPCRGVLYAGLMITKQGPKASEYNVRFGDPECQPLLMRLKTDLVDLLEATVEGRLDQIGPLEWDSRPAVCVVMASQGYPGGYTRGHPIRGLVAAESMPDVKIFHAGTSLQDGEVVTDGGRVLSVTAMGDTIAKAKLNAYRAVKCIRWPGRLVSQGHFGQGDRDCGELRPV